jgi:Tfp pilus assembly protein PilV
MNFCKLRKKLKLDNKGNTMFETLVAFVVLAIILAIVYQMIAFCALIKHNLSDFL